MTEAIRNFVDQYKKKPKPVLTVKDWIKEHNHEIWRKCKVCGNEEDIRKNQHCTSCWTDLLKQ